MPRPRIYEPQFSANWALYIIWCESRVWGRFSLAAGSRTTIAAAWDASQEKQPQDLLILKEGAKLLRRRDPLSA